MPAPSISEIILDEVRNLQGRFSALHETVVAHCSKEEDRWAEIEQTRAAIEGNGTPGFKVRIDRLERLVARLKWVATFLVAPICVYGAYTLIQHFFLSQ